jgi:ubiquinone/menaquinone biosynthesis C-methylase UbiE
MSKDFFNARAAHWDSSAAEQDTSRLKAMAGRLEILPGSAVLDVGTGTGVFVPCILGKIGRAGKLVCLDYAEEMLAAARAKHFTGDIKYVCADVVETGLPDSAFDAVVCYSVFPHFDHPFLALREIARVLKPQGRLYVCHTSARLKINEIHRNIPEVCDHLLPENEDLRRMLIETGFIDIIIDDGADDYLVSARKPDAAPSNLSS